MLLLTSKICCNSCSNAPRSSTSAGVKRRASLCSSNSQQKRQSGTCYRISFVFCPGSSGFSRSHPDWIRPSRDLMVRSVARNTALMKRWCIFLMKSLIAPAICWLTVRWALGSARSCSSCWHADSNSVLRSAAKHYRIVLMTRFFSVWAFWSSVRWR